MKATDIEEMKTYFETESGGADKLCFFDKRVAKFVGVDAAMIFNHMAFLITANEDAGRNYHDGKHWSYMTAKEIANKLEVLNERQVKYIIVQLEDAGLLESANYNKLKCDKTKWYALTDLGRKAYGRCSQRPVEEENLTDKIDNREYENVPSTSKFVRGNGPTKDKFVRAIPNNIYLQHGQVFFSPQGGVETNKPICQNGTSNTNNITHHQQSNFSDTTVANISPSTEREDLEKNVLALVVRSSTEGSSSSTTEGCSSVSTNFSESKDDDELSKKPAKMSVKNIITKANDEVLEFFTAIFGEPTVRESIALGYMSKTYGTEKLLDALNRANCVCDDDIQNPTGYLLSVLRKEKRD